MNHPCNCNPPAVVSTIVGDRCHITNERGEWCAIINKDGVYLQNLLVPSSEEITREQEHQQKILAEQSIAESREARKQELKAKLDSGETLTLQELTELLKLAL
jgi:hypothetical protein